MNENTNDIKQQIAGVLDGISLAKIQEAAAALLSGPQTCEVGGVTIRKVASDDFDKGLTLFGEQIVAEAQGDAEGQQGLSLKFNLESALKLVAKLPALSAWLLKNATDLSDADAKKLPQDLRALILAGVICWNWTENSGWRCFFGSAESAAASAVAEQLSAAPLDSASATETA